MRNLQINKGEQAATLTRNLTAGAKTNIVNNNVGNRQAKNQQATSRQLYDSIALDGRTSFEFFNNVSSKTFPFANINENKLKVGETFTLMRMWFGVMTVDAVTGAFTNIISLTTAARTAIYGGQFTVSWDTQIVMKPYPLASSFPSFNHMSMNATNENICFDNMIVLPPDIAWQVTLQTPTYTALANAFLRCNMEGFGTILSAKTQF